MEYYKYLRQYVGHKPIILPGSVVIIFNEQNEVLLQKRHDGYWGLPGGLMDLGESFEEVAKREVYEETGLVVENLKLLNVFSGSEYYLLGLSFLISVIANGFGQLSNSVKDASCSSDASVLLAPIILILIPVLIGVYIINKK